MVLKKKMLVKLLLGLMLLIGFSGCVTRQIVLHPIEKSDIFFITKGSIITVNNESIKVEKDGCFVSQYYIDQVMKAKIGK